MLTDSQSSLVLILLMSVVELKAANTSVIQGLEICNCLGKPLIFFFLSLRPELLNDAVAITVLVKR